MTVPADEIPLEVDPAEQVRFPDIVFTDGYLNSPIHFTVPREFYDGIIPHATKRNQQVYERDIAQFINVTIDPETTDEIIHPVLAVSQVWNRTQFARLLNTNFEEFLD